jgi:PPK2 family polyphosphate:nucleotide phosphotransferase
MKKSLSDRLRVKPGKKVRLGQWDPGDTAGMTRENVEAALQKNIDRLFELQYGLSAENRRSVLVVLQAMDAGGKDGTIRNVMRGLNPQGVRVTPFKAPSQEELEHDFLWRIHANCPRAGDIGIFNRSHYEDVLVVRVKKLVPKEIWSRRYQQINDFEKMLVDNRTTIVKFYLHISKNEQADRLRKRLEDPHKNWKFEPADIEERERWDEYMEAYEAALSRCSTECAPWYIIPANRKWFRDYAVSSILIEAIEKMKCKPPKAKYDLSQIVIR